MSGKSKSGRSLNEELGDEDSERKRKGTFFSWSRTRSTGRSQKKKDHGDHADGVWCVALAVGRGLLGGPAAQKRTVMALLQRGQVHIPAHSRDE